MILTDQQQKAIIEMNRKMSDASFAISQLSNGLKNISSVWNCKNDIPHVSVQRTESAAEEFNRTHGEGWWKGGFDMRSEQTWQEYCNTIDVTFEEVIWEHVQTEQ